METLEYDREIRLERARVLKKENPQGWSFSDYSYFWVKISDRHGSLDLRQTFKNIKKSNIGIKLTNANDFNLFS